VVVLAVRQIIQMGAQVVVVVALLVLVQQVQQRVQHRDMQVAQGQQPHHLIFQQVAVVAQVRLVVVLQAVVQMVVTAVTV